MLEILMSDKNISLFETNNLSELTNTNGWTFTPSEGWFKNDYNWNAGYDLVVPGVDLKRIRVIQATVTGYYNTPAGCMGLNLLSGTFGSTTLDIGTNDAWDYGPTGQEIYRGSLPLQPRATKDAINETYEIIVPDNAILTRLFIRSSGYSGAGINYPFSKRGIKNFKVWYK